MTDFGLEPNAPAHPPDWYSGKDPSRLDNRTLVHRVRAGDEEAYAIIVERYTPAVMGCIAGKVRTPSDMEDLAQDVFLRAYRFFDTLREPEALGAWLMGIARSSVADYHRRHSRRLKVIHRPADEESGAMEFVADPAPGPDETAMARQARDMVLEEVSRLGETYRVVIYMRLVGEESTPDIARILGLRPETVRKRLFRGLRQLRRALGKRGLDLDAGLRPPSSDGEAGQ